jgi:glycosyltransferase involved in cell wall biosynthesis
MNTPACAVVMPCFRVGARALDVITRIGPEVERIYVVDDCCPLGTGELVAAQCHDPRVRVITHQQNLGVGGAVISGYLAALADGMDIVVKVDGDGQMDPSLIGRFIRPIIDKRADYTKGNRFHRVRNAASMPALRLFGNTVLSFMTKASSGYWQVFDPTNGFTAIHRSALQELDLPRLARRYFFESDMLFQLNQARAVVLDIPMMAKYEDEPSSLVPSRIVLPFLRGHARNFFRRIFGSYFLRGFSVASVELVLGMAMVSFSLCFGGIAWYQSVMHGTPASAGTVMLAALPLILGFQLLLSWLNYDVAAEPRMPLQNLLG